jgi:hypothetical protein
VIARDHVGECFGEVLPQRPVLLAVAEHGLLRESAHVHGPFDDLATAAELQPPFIAHDGDEAKINVGRVRPVDLHLPDGGGVAGVQRREVDEAQVHALAQLVGVLTNKEHAGAVGLDDVDALIAAAVRGGVAEEGADLALFLVGEFEHRVDRHAAT